MVAAIDLFPQIAESDPQPCCTTAQLTDRETP
jgi:hypothetical protein